MLIRDRGVQPGEVRADGGWMVGGWWEVVQTGKCGGGGGCGTGERAECGFSLLFAFANAKSKSGKDMEQKKPSAINFIIISRIHRFFCFIPRFVFVVRIFPSWSVFVAYPFLAFCFPLEPRRSDQECPVAPGQQSRIHPSCRWCLFAQPQPAIQLAGSASTQSSPNTTPAT